MRIGFIGHQASKEGAGRFLFEEIEYLLAQGIHPFAIFPEDGPLSVDLRRLGVEIAFVPYTWWNKPHGLRGPAEYEEALVAAHAMAEILVGWQVDIVYTHTIVAGAGPLAASLAGLPHVWHLHEFSYKGNAIEMALPQRSLGRFIDLTTNLVFFNSRGVAAEWEGVLSAAKTQVVYNWLSAADHDEARQATMDPVARSMLDGNTFVAASVGSVIPFKRHIDAVQAVGRLIREGLDIGLLVVGPPLHPGAHAELVAVISENGWSDRIRLLGYSDNPRQLMREAEVTLVCSDSESFGRVTIESMSERTPVIGANFGGTAEIVREGVNGLLYQPGDVDGLSSRLRELVENAELRARLAAGALQTADDFRGPERSMTPAVASLRALVGSANPSSPLGTLIGTGYSAGLAASVNIPRPSLRRKAIAKIRRTIRRIW